MNFIPTQHLQHSEVFPNIQFEFFLKIKTIYFLPCKNGHEAQHITYSKYFQLIYLKSYGRSHIFFRTNIPTLLS